MRTGIVLGLILWLLPVVSSAEHFKLPNKVVSLLSQHTDWQTNFFFKPSFSFFPIHIAKRWKLVKQGQYLSLRELGVRPSNQLALSEPLSIDAFSCSSCVIPKSKEYTQLTVDIFDQDKVLISSPDNDWFMLLFPHIQLKGSVPQLKQHDVNVARTPLGLYEDELRHTYALSSTPTTYLHHDRSSPLPVKLIKGFPSQYLPTLKRIISRWNAALGRTFLILDQEAQLPETATATVCMSARVLCMAWHGPPDISFVSGLPAHTDVNFDPINGKVIGGIISFYASLNPGGLRKLKDTLPEDVVTHFKTLDRRNIAKLSLFHKQIGIYRHPKPFDYFASILSTELGHLNGWKHNFYGSNSGTASEPSLSIMDILPFPVVHLGKGELGPYDHQMIDLVYHGKLPQRAYRNCGTLAATQKDLSIRNSQCNTHDLGNPVDWYLELAQLNSPKGVFTKLESDKSLLYHLGLCLVESPQNTSTQEEQERVKTYLCHHPMKSRLLRLLKRYLKIDVDCSS